MFIVQSYPLAVFFCFITMLCWGSWANTQKLASKSWPSQLYYWDYTLGLVILALVFGLTLGSNGEQGRGFIADLQQANGSALGSALLGGIIFNLSNLLIVAAIDIAGMAVAFPIAVGIALVLGVVVNYLADSSGNPVLLFGGIAMVTIAIILSAIAYRKLPNNTSKASTLGIVVSVLSGIIMGFFYRFVADAISTDFYNPEAGKMTTYSAVFIFSIGIFLSNFIWNTYFMYKPLKGEPTSYKDYFTKGNLWLHIIGILGGIIWNIGMSFSLIASSQAGPTISYGLGQGATMVGVGWGVFIWKEFKTAPKGTNIILATMFACFIIGLILVIAAKG
ncbi:MAG: GRP family sugar transporter [Bacteroidota bacterium]|nr:GRP family sugar transporter [Bacteroidota bacterium]